MSDFNLNDQREYYEHDHDCKIPEDLGKILPNSGAVVCNNCLGVFKPDGKEGVAITSKIFDEPELPGGFGV